MKLIRYRFENQIHTGVVTADGIAPVADDLLSIIQSGKLPAVPAGAATVAFDQVTPLLPYDVPPKIWCIGLNYKTHAEDYGSPDQLKLRTITIRRTGAPDSKRKMMEEIREKIMGGAEFGDLARMYSEDDKQEAFGDWGWIDKRTLNESLSKAAFALKAGEVSKVIELAGSYYLLQAEAKKPATVKPLKDVHDEIEKGLLQLERQKQQADWIAKLRKKAFIKMY